MLERVWSSTHRNSVVAMLKSIGTVILTAPNFSVYNNVPRPENLYNIKRIALLSREFLAAGVPTALHVNASTDSDYDQFGEFLSARSEFQAISFEFITGPGYPSRQWWHVRKLIELQNKLGRQVQLVLRGGTTALRALSAAFADIVVIDSDPLHRALHRQRMIFGNDGHIKSVRNHLPQGIPVDELLIQNVMAAKLEIDYALRHPNMNIARNIWRKKLRSAGNRHDESRQLDFLANSTSGEARAGSADAERMVAASKSEGAAEIQKTSKEVTKSAAVSGGSSKSRSPVG